MNKKGGVFILFLCLAIFSKAQKYSFINYSTKQGLAQSQVLDIKQDSKGYLWIATLEGLSKFNGKKFFNYYESDGIVSHKLNSLFIDDEDNVWAVSTDGISIVTEDSIIPFEHNQIFDGKRIKEVIVDNDRIWISTRLNGIYCFKKEKTTGEIKFSKKYKTDFNKLIIRDISLLSSKLYVGTDEGVFIIENDQVTKLKEFDNQNVSSIGENSKGELWIGTLENGIYKLNKRGITHIHQLNSKLLNDYIDNIYVDKKDNVWICTNYDLSKIESNLNIQNYFSDNGFDYIPEVSFEDSDGNIWIGTAGHGLVKFTNTEFRYLKNKELNTDLVISISEDKNESIWLGTLGEGVSKVDGKSFKVYNAKESSPNYSSLPNNNVWDIYKDMNGMQYFATSDGLALFFKNDFLRYTAKYHNLPDDKVQSLYQEESDVLWIGTKKGVAFLKKGIITPIDSFPYTNVRAITSTQDGLYWFGTSQGVVKYDGFELELIREDLLLNNTVYTILDYGNKLWIGTQNGLVYYDGTKFERFNFSQRNNSAINQLLIDRDNFLWIGTNQGIYTLNLLTFNEGKKEIVSYTTNNGLIGMETNLNAIFQDSKDNIWIGTNEGVNIFKRDKEKQNKKIVPQIHFTSVKLFFGDENYLNPLRGKAPIKFGFKQNMVTFNYHTNYFKDPSAVKYSYKLKGLDEEWSPMEPTSSTRYPNLSHGEYTFMVKSSVDGKEWSNIDEVSFVIKAPYWLTWWFRTSILLVLSLIVYFLINRRRKAIKKEREVELLNYKNKLIKLEQQSLNASMNRHFIFNSLNSIQFYINKEDKLSANRYLSNFSKLIRRNLDSSSAEDNLIPLSEEIERLTLYLSLENMRFKEKFSYEINMDPEVDAEMTKVPAMFMQPFIENSIWHGILPMENPGKIDIDIYREGDKTIFEITDNGIGINTSIKNKSKEQNEHSSKGMKIATNRIELLQKVIQKEITIDGPREIIEDDKIKGTKVIIVFG